MKVKIKLSLTLFAAVFQSCSNSSWYGVDIMNLNNQTVIIQSIDGLGAFGDFYSGINARMSPNIRHGCNFWMREKVYYSFPIKITWLFTNSPNKHIVSYIPSFVNVKDKQENMSDSSYINIVFYDKHVYALWIPAKKCPTNLTDGEICELSKKFISFTNAGETGLLHEQEKMELELFLEDAYNRSQKHYQAHSNLGNF